MKFQCQVSSLQDAVATAVKALNARPSSAILEGILLEAKNNEVRLTCSDLSLTIEATAEAAVLEEGEQLLSGRLFSEIIKKLPPDTVEIKGDSKIIIQCVGSKTTLTALNADEFPSLPIVDDEIYLNIEQSKLRELIQKTIFSVGTDDSRPILKGVLFEYDAEKLSLVAIDGYRMAIASTTIDSEHGSFSAVIPAKALSELTHILKEDDSIVRFIINDKYAAFETNGSRVITRLLDGEFMNYRQIIPTESTTTVVVPTETMNGAVSRASLIAFEGKNNLVKFKLTENIFSISSNSDQSENNEHVNDYEFSGKPLDIAFNVKYINDILKNVNDDKIKLMFQASFNPCVVTPCDGDDYLYLVLPVRVFNA